MLYYWFLRLIHLDYLISMQAVIICAGKGERLTKLTKGKPKPLIPLLGIPLIIRIILNARAAGIDEFIIVVGYAHEAISSYLKEFAHREHLNLKIVYNPDWQSGNGTSVLAAEPYVDDHFLLLMGDHIFDPQVLSQFLRITRQPNTSYILADTDIAKGDKLHEATKLQIGPNNHVLNIGKHLHEFNAIDTGIFILHRSVFSALRKSIEHGDYTLTGGMLQLIQTSQLVAFPIHGFMWCDIDTPTDLRLAETLLLRQLPKPQEDGIISRHLNRPISLQLSRLFARGGVHPNLISLSVLLLSVVAAVMFASTTTWLWMIAGILVQIASILDGCDGEVARLLHKARPFGGWFDTLLDRYGELILCLGITYGYWRVQPYWWVPLLAVLPITGFILASYTRKEYHLRYNKPYPLNVWNYLSKRDLRLFLIFLGSIFFVPYWMMIAIGGLTHLCINMMFITIRWQSHS